MIHIVIGTKAQLIKMVPILKGLKERKIGFNLIDLGQHSLITQDLREEFDLDDPDYFLFKGKNISTLKQAALWVIKIFFKSLAVSWIKKELFLNKDGVCLIHGDTVSTLIGLYLAKRAKLKIAHIEAGLRSFCWREPFPEEIFRVIAMRFSDILFAPSQWAFNNLENMGFKNKAILIPGNTGQESAQISASRKIAFSDNLLRFSVVGKVYNTFPYHKKTRLDLEMDNFCLFTFHRIENILFKRRLGLAVKILLKISSRMPVIFIPHPPTLNSLRKTGLINRLQGIKNIHYHKILSHGQFLGLLEKCSFVVSDGGSIQEEAFYLGKPCLLLRKRTERKEGLGENAILSNLDQDKIDFFLNHYASFQRKAVSLNVPGPSAKIIEKLLKYA
mgnify:CR=1 FL=1